MIEYQCISNTDLGQVGQFKSDGSGKCVDYQCVDKFEPLIVNWQGQAVDRAQLIAASEKAERGGTPQLRNPYTPCRVSLTDFRGFLAKVPQAQKSRKKSSRVGGMGVRRK